MKGLTKYYLFALPLCLAGIVWAANQPVDVPTRSDDLEEIQLKSRLEETLARDISAYLGNMRFIVNVDVKLEKIRQVIKSKPAPVVQEKAQQNNQPELQFPKTPAANANNEDDSLPGLPFVELNQDKEKDAEIQFMREQIERLQRLARQPRWQENSDENSPEASEQTVAVYNKIKKLIVTLIVEAGINQEQEAFLRNLVFQKAALNELRGDELKIVRTEFSKDMQADLEKTTPLATIQQSDEPVAVQQPETWLEENFEALALGGLIIVACLILILLLVVLLRKKEKPVSRDEPSQPLQLPAPAAASHGENHPPEVKATALKPAEQIAKYRQDVISMGLGQPQHAAQVMDELVSQEEKIKLAAGVYKVLGRSLYRSLFPAVGQQPLQQIMAFLADTPPDEEQQLNDMRDFHQLLTQHIQQQDTPKAAPFEFLQKLNDAQVIFLIQQEDPRIQALVISQLPAERGAAVLNRVAANKQSQVIAELGQFDSFPLEAFRDVAERLAKAALKAPSFENINADGLGMLIKMLDNMSGAEENKVLQKLRSEKPDMFFRLRQQYFTFADVVRTPKQILSNALREVERAYIGRALCNTPDDFKIYVLSCLPDKLRLMAQEELKRCEGRIQQKDVDIARRKVVGKMREYIATGKLSMDKLSGASAAQPGGQNGSQNVAAKKAAKS
ncbi:MAG: hypothetical protein H7A10_07945 [Oceanospirillaceae bacterium]|nr:hypothetical protein [Oceanospirillaceae bacterium]